MENKLKQKQKQKKINKVFPLTKTKLISKIELQAGKTAVI